MNNTVTLPQLISLLAAKAGCTPAEARKYLHDLFAQVEEALSRGESYTIDGIGEFAPGFEAGNPVLFRPDEALAAALNEPFSAFTAMELPADMPAEALDAPPAETVAESLPTEEPPVEETPAEETPAEEAPAEEAPAEDVPAEETPAEEAPTEEVPVEDVPAEEVSAEETPDEDATVQEEEEPEAEFTAPTAVQQGRPTAMWLTIGILIGLIVGLVAGYFAGADVGRYYIPQDEDEYFDDDTVTIAIVEPVQIQQAAAAAPVDTAAAPVAAPEPQPVAAEPVAAPAEPAKPTKPEPKYDTITSTQFLTTLARKHYGVKNYWIFIYEANPSLGNPNSIRPGTRVVIPDRSTFEGPTPEATAAKAQERLNALARRYKL